MSALFLKIVNMSINATWLILAVLVLRLLMKKVPRWITCVLWALVAVRLVCPFSLESAFSLLPSGEVISQDIAMERKPVIYTGIPSVNNMVNPVISETFTPETGDSANPLQIVIAVAAVVWAAGVLLMLSYAFISFLLLKRRVRASIPVGERIMVCDEVKSPFILGMFRPVIYMPSSLSGQTFELVKAHETAHIRRLDHWWKPLGFALLAVYWFNPACWMAYILLCRDIEAACDEKVIQDKGRGYAAAYSEALLALSMPRRVIAACPLAFGETDVKRRIKGVLNYKKPAFWVILCALVGCVVVAVCFMTNPVSKKGEEKAEVQAHSQDGANTLQDEKASQDATPQTEALYTPEELNRIFSEEALASATISVIFSEVPRPTVNLAATEGADETQILYADKDIIIFSDYYGLFVYSKEDRTVIDGLDLISIGCSYTQGDNTCERYVSEDASTVYLHPMATEDVFVYQYGRGRLTKEPFHPEYLEGVRLHTLPAGNEVYHYGNYDEWTDNGKQMVTMLYHGGTIGELCYADFEKGQETEARQYPLFVTYGLSGVVDFASGDMHEQMYYYICGRGGRDGDRLLLDDVEWITAGTERAKELGLTEDDMPSGFFIFNLEGTQEPVTITDACTFTILDWEDNYSVKQVDKDTFLRILDERLAFFQEIEEGLYGPPYIIERNEKGSIVSVTEQYVP